MKNEKYIIELAHPMREMLAGIVLNLSYFEISEHSEKMIMINQKNQNNTKKSVWGNSLQKKIFEIITKIQKKIGLINFRIYFAKKECDLICGHGGFLITNKPYFTYIEKATQVYGYTARNYGKFLSKVMLKYFLKDKKLKKIFFLTRAALDGMANIEEIDLETKRIIKEKGVVIYPPLENLGKSDLKRFADTSGNLKFLYISSSFYGKGGLELVSAFEKLQKEVNNIELIIITDRNSVEKNDLEKILKNNKIKLYDYIFSRQELFDKFLNKCHVFCYATYSDSFSAVVNEAIAADLPIITSDFFSIPERVIEGYNGFLFKSPFPNYDEKFVIWKEHFTDFSNFLENIFENQKLGKLKFVEDFLYEKMRFFLINKNKLQEMALNSRKTYEEKINPQEIRKNIDNILKKCLND